MDNISEIKFKIAVANTKTQKTWKNIEVSWDELVKRAENPIRTSETAAEYKAMPKAEKDAKKDVGGFVGGYLKDGIRKRGQLETRQLICLDADNIRGGVDFPAKVAEALEDKYYLYYTTHSHTKDKPRFRLIIPLSREVTADEYEPIARLVARDIGIDMFDPTTYQEIRLMYWPSAPSDGEYLTDHYGLELLNPDDVKACNPNWQDATTWPTGPSEAAAHKMAIKKLGDPREKPGIIGLFCQAYTISEAIDAYLPGIYERVERYDDRYTYMKGSTTGGAVTYDDLLLYSHHGTDPVGGREVNAFDLVRIHQFGLLDAESDPGTPVAKLPSFVAMTSLCNKDDKVKALRNKGIMEALSDDLLEADGVDIGTDEQAKAKAKAKALEWLNGLERTKTGKLVASAHNFLLILRNDPRLKGMAGNDLFASRIAVLKDLPWRQRMTNQIDNWRDSDDAELRNYLSLKYEGLTGKALLDDALTTVFAENSFHPVRDWLGTLKWDGVPRIRRILIDYLGAKQGKYTEEITEKFFKAAIARVFKPGIKFDFCLVISGPQGIGKSTILRMMGGKWFNDSIISLKGKEAMDQLQGAWINELSEMQATTKSENEEIKAFISRQNDRYRPPYGHRVEDHLRQCVFAATTNEHVFLKDRTGARRFWIVMCDDKAEKPLKEFTKEVAEQCWAELMSIYAKNKELLPSDEALKEARELQEEHTEGSEKFGLIEAYLDTKLPERWMSMNVQERRLWLAGETSVEGEGVVTRERVCAMEVWCECFGNNPERIRNLDAREINNILRRMPGWRPHDSNEGKLRFKWYGKQRAYINVSAEQELWRVSPIPEKVSPISDDYLDDLM
jgi:predicted P-loop ATPase